MSDVINFEDLHETRLNPVAKLWRNFYLQKSFSGIMKPLAKSCVGHRKNETDYFPTIALNDSWALFWIIFGEKYQKRFLFIIFIQIIIYRNHNL